jgi:hypothetical protein
LLATAIDEFNAAIASIEHEEAAARKQAEADAIRAETLALARKLLGFAFEGRKLGRELDERGLTAASCRALLDWHTRLHRAGCLKPNKQLCDVGICQALRRMFVATPIWHMIAAPASTATFTSITEDWAVGVEHVAQQLFAPYGELRELAA